MNNKIFRGAGGYRLLALSILVLTPLYYLIPWKQLTSSMPWLSFGFFLAYTIILPGVLWMHLLSPRKTDVFDRAAGAVLFGLSCFLICAFIWALSPLSLGIFSKAFPVLVAAPAVVALTIHRPRLPVFEVAAVQSRPWGSAVCALALFLLFIPLLKAGPPIYFTKDTLDHVSYVREIAEVGTAFPTDAFYLDPGMNGADIRKGLLHDYYGYAAFFLGAPALQVLTVMNAVLAIAFILTAYSMALWFFGNRAIAILSALLFLLAHDRGLAKGMLVESYYSHRFGLAFFWIFLVFAMRFLDRRGRRDLWLAALFAYAACATHVFFGLLVALAGATIMAWKVCFPQRSFLDHARGVVTLGAAVALAVLPYALFRYLTAYPSGVNELHDQVQGVVMLGKSIYVAQPFRLLSWFGPIGIVTFAAVIPLWSAMKKSYAIGFLVSSLLTIPLVLFNPILLPPLHRAVTYLVFRMTNLCPFFALTAFFLYAFFRDPDFRRRRKVWSAVVAAALIVAIASAALSLRDGGILSPANQAHDREYSYLRWKDALDRLDKTLPERSVIASDPLTSYSITAFTPYHVVCTLDQHAPPNDALLEERVRDARDILSPYVSMQRTTELLDRHHATHIILNNRQPRRFLLEYWFMDRDIYQESMRKFESHPELFSARVLDTDFVLFEWNGQQAESDTIPSSLFKVESVPADFTRVGYLAGDAVLEGIQLGRPEVARGDTVDVHLVWSASGHYSLRNYVVSIRFDHVDPDLPLGGRPFPKLLRKIKEKMIGGRFRFREQHKVRNGFLSPDTWSSGDLVVDGTRIAVPRDLIPGRYTVSVKLFEEIHQPNTGIRDYLYDNDVYQGIAVSEIVID